MSSRAARARGFGPYESTVPAPLAGSEDSPALELALPGDLAADVADAENALAAFDARASARLGADHPALGPMSAVLLRTESASSSQIEDLTVGARQLALAELEESRSANARAVVANVRTMEAALRLAADLDLDAVLAMHAELLVGQPAAGALREQLVWVGRSGVSPLGAAQIAPEAELVRPALEDLLAFVARDDLPVLLTDLPAYVEALTAYRAGDARPIIEQFARAARCAAASGTRLVDDLAAQLEAGRKRLSGVRRHALAWAVLPLLVGQPVVTTDVLTRRLGTTTMTAGRALSQLTEAGILQETTGRSRHPIWQHSGILGILDGYAADVRRQG